MKEVELRRIGKESITSIKLLHDLGFKTMVLELSPGSLWKGYTVTYPKAFFTID